VRGWCDVNARHHQLLPLPAICAHKRLLSLLCKDIALLLSFSCFLGERSSTIITCFSEAHAKDAAVQLQYIHAAAAQSLYLHMPTPKPAEVLSPHPIGVYDPRTFVQAAPPTSFASRTHNTCLDRGGSSVLSLAPSHQVSASSLAILLLLSVAPPVLITYSVGVY
jgi:hypothetical protein